MTAPAAGHAPGLTLSLDKATSDWPAEIISSDNKVIFSFRGDGTIKRQNEIGELIVRSFNSRADLLDALETLKRAYINLLEVGHERIINLGGACDAVEVMVSGDPALIATDRALASARDSSSKGERM